MANSGAICARPSTWVDMVRPGALLYGYYQSFDPPQKGHEVKRRLPIEPSLAMRARIITLRDLPPGQGVGYSARFVTERPTRIAVINAGYADGISRLRTNRGCALVRGKRVPLVGTISMDLTTLDVTDVPGVDARRRSDYLWQRWQGLHCGFRRGGGNRNRNFGPALRTRPPRAPLLPLIRIYPIYSNLIDSAFPDGAILATSYSFICIFYTDASGVFIKSAEGSKESDPLALADS